MSALSFLVNCIILCVAFRGTFSMPGKITVLKINKTDNILIRDTSCPCDRQPLKSYWDELPTSNVNVQGTSCVCNLGMSAKPLPEDYWYTHGIGMHKLHTRGQTWNTARKICNQEGGHLAIINSDAEALIMAQLFYVYRPFKGAHRINEAFVGMHDIYKEGDWTTILGDPLVETGYTKWSNWLRPQPDNGAGANPENCGGIYWDGTIDDVECDLPFAFFCEIPEITPL